MTRDIKVEPIRMAPWFTTAMAKGAKVETRRLITEKNSVCGTGLFSQLALEDAKIEGDPIGGVHLKARADLGTYKRTTTVRPVMRPGDLLWVRHGRGAEWATRAGSQMTLMVMDVRPDRLQSITNQEAVREGMSALRTVPFKELVRWRIMGDSTSWSHDWLCDQMPRSQLKAYLTSRQLQEIIAKGKPEPRDTFALAWDLLHGPGEWARNPWVWVVTFYTMVTNVDVLLRDEQKIDIDYRREAADGCPSAV